MLGRMALWEGGRGFGVDREEQAAAKERKRDLVRILFGHIITPNYNPKLGSIQQN